MHYWSENIRKVLEDLKTSSGGLSEQEARRRLAIYGPNELKREKKISLIRIFLEQFSNVLILVLIAATIITLLIGHVIDSILILIIIIINAVVGVVQEYRAERAIEALKKMTALKATVLRDGKHAQVDATDVVPGDVFELIEGDKIAADCRIIEAINLQIDESMLTGESTPVDKKNIEVQDSARLPDRTNMVYTGTAVVRGHAKAVVVFTGMNTEVGKIAKEIEAPAPPTPLQLYMDRFGKKIGIVVILTCAIVFAIGTYSEENLLSLFLIAVSLAVAAIPQALPVIVTISLAFGAKKMASKNALVKKLSAVEALGSATVICTDKTGTLTENRMAVKKVYCDGKITSVKECKNKLIFQIGLVCNNSVLEKIDPTEVALVESAKERGIEDKEFFEYKRIVEIPFSSQTKLMTFVCQKGEEEIVMMKGAPSAVLARCNRMMEHGRVVRLTLEKKNEIEKAIDEMAAKALRVLAFAYKSDKKKLEEDLIFVGVQGMIDPPRKEIKSAVSACKTAGIRVIIVTGDHPLTAKAVAEDIGLVVENIITGDEVENFSFEELRVKVRNTTIFARVEPAQKNRIVKALRANGEIVAVTGDGVNDAPALKNADIGVAMGMKGTDVAKEASDIIITDDNFATIVSAVEEGRRIFDNIKKSMIYLLSTNMGEVLIVFIAALFLLPLPLAAVQILWINLLTDGLPALALSVDHADPRIMKRKPNTSKGEVLNQSAIFAIVRTGALMAIASLTLYVLFLNLGDLNKAQTVTFTAVVFLELVILQTVRQQYNQSLLTNRYLLLSIFLVMVIQLFIIYSPLNSLFHIVPLTLGDWTAILLTVAVVFAFNHFFHRLIKIE